MRVVIVGSGFAGLGCARSLIESGAAQVVLLESGDAVGGRARSAELPSGVPVELGATWFHGVRDNPLFDVALWQGIAPPCDPEAAKHDISWQLHFARPLEQALISGDQKQVALDAVARYSEAAEESMRSLPHVGDAAIGDFLRRTFDEAVAADLSLTGETLQAFAAAWHFREQLQRTFDGFSSSDDCSIAFAQAYEALDGPNIPVPGGFQALAEVLAQDLDVRLNHRVTRIIYGPAGAQVVCANGVVLEADHVVVTVSLGVLQAQHVTLFDPPLPQWKLDAMQALRIGVADKIFIEYEIAPAYAKEAAAWLLSHAQQPHQSTSQPLASNCAVDLNPSPNHLTPLATGDDPPLKRSAAEAHPWPAPTPPRRSAPVPVAGRHALSTDAPLLHQGFPHPIGQALATLLPPAGTHQNLMHRQPHPFSTGDGTSWPTSADGLLIAGLGSPSPVMYRSSTSGLTAYSEDSSTSCGAAGLQAASFAILWPGAPGDEQGLPGQPEGNQGSGITQMGEDTNGADSFLAHLGVGLGGVAAVAPRSRRRKQRRTMHTYVLMWPVSEPLLLGRAGHPSALPPPPSPACGTPFRWRGCSDPWLVAPPCLESLQLPCWAVGLHSLRYCPGPEWILPILLQEGGAGAGKRAAGAVLDPGVNAADGGCTHVSAVLWITGEAALAMEAASDQEVVAGLQAVLQAFPQVPRPPGAQMPPRVVRSRWGSDPAFRGSYSYVGVGRTGSGVVVGGDAVEALAEPLCNEQGVPIVMFAGEATQLNHMGTAHGAFLSGHREAARLLEWLPMAGMQDSSPETAGLFAGLLSPQQGEMLSDVYTEKPWAQHMSDTDRGNGQEGVISHGNGITASTRGPSSSARLFLPEGWLPS